MGTHRVTVELQEDSYNLLRSVVDSGEYASESQVIDNLIAQLGPGAVLHQAVLKHWMLDEVLPAIDEYDNDPSSGMTPEQLRSRLATASLAWPNGS